MKVTTLSEKAMLVKLTTRRARLSQRNTALEQIVQAQFDDASLIVNSKLFRDKDNPIRQILSAISEAYSYHKEHTVPYIDKGPRILPNAVYMEYTTEMRNRIQQTDALLAKHMPNYDQYVQMDIQYRSRGPNSTAKVEDYPTADEFQARIGVDLRFMPLPDQKHFLFDLSDEDVANFSQAMMDAERMARNDALTRMLEPLQHLVEKLNKPIKSDGSVFRDSAIENIIEGVDVARKLLIDPSPEVQSVMETLNQAISKYANNSEWLRESPIVREQAAKQLDDIAKQMGAFMGA